MSDTQQFRRMHFSLKDRIVSFLSDKVFQNFSYTVRHGLIQGMKRKGGLGFLPAAFARSPQGEAEVAFLFSLDLKDKVVYDIGAFQGIMTLFFARQAKTVVTYEPHPASHRRVLENVEVNALHNVIVLNRAVGDRDGTLTLTYDPLLPGAASGDSIIRAQIVDSHVGAVTLAVTVVRLDDDIERSGLPLPDFIKIDIEGMELAALVGMKNTLLRCRPAVYIEMHGATVEEKEENARRVIQLLTEITYQNIVHIESGAMITPSNASMARQGHIFCTSRSQA
jgi:FkbM family methyltransferase